MKKILYLILIILSYNTGYSQAIDNISKTKTVNFLFSNYSISIPKKMRITESVNRGVHTCSIRFKKKALSNTVQVFIYYGSYPPTYVNNNSKYNFIDSIEIKILFQNTNFKIYQTDNSYYIEGFIPINQDELNEILPNSSLQFKITGRCVDKKYLNSMIEIIRNFNLTELEIIVGQIN